MPALMGCRPSKIRPAEASSAASTAAAVGEASGKQLASIAAASEASARPLFARPPKPPPPALRPSDLLSNPLHKYCAHGLGLSRLTSWPESTAETRTRTFGVNTYTDPTGYLNRVSAAANDTVIVIRMTSDASRLTVEVASSDNDLLRSLESPAPARRFHSAAKLNCSPSPRSRRAVFPPVGAPAAALAPASTLGAQCSRPLASYKSLATLQRNLIAEDDDEERLVNEQATQSDK